MTTRPHDVIIAGSGPAGAATAIALARAGRRVLMVEKRRAPRARIGETIAPAAKPLVEGLLGAVPDRALPDWAAACRGNISIWGAVEPAVQDFFFGAYGPGLCVDRAGFDAALLNVARGLGVEMLSGTTITDARRKGAHWTVSLTTPTGPQQLACAFLVDATGRAAALAKALGVQRNQDDALFSYALRFTTETLTNRDGYTRIEACPYGWWYSNRLPSANTSQAERLIVLHTDRDLSEARQAASAEGLLNLLKDTTLMRQTLADHGYASTGSVHGAPAGGTPPAQHTINGFLAVGDAAQALDPLSSQGIEQALQSGAHAGHALHYALSNPDAPQPFLDRYAHRQRAQWQTYQKHHAYFYGMEPRWPDHAFWAGRRAHSISSQPIPAKGAP